MVLRVSSTMATTPNLHNGGSQTTGTRGLCSTCRAGRLCSLLPAAAPEHSPGVTPQ